MSSSRRTFLRQTVIGALQFGVLSDLIAREKIILKTGSLPRSTPEGQGFSSESILRFVEAVNESNLHSLMIVRRGHVVAEGWWAPYAPELKHTLYSLSKSFTSTAIGFAVKEGTLTVNDKVVSFFADKLPASFSENLAAMRIKDLLTMSTGHDKDTVGNFRTTEENDWVKVFLAQPVAYQPGTHFVYNSGATYMLSAILQKVTGQNLTTYLTPRLFDPLHISGFDWETDSQGIDVGGWGLRLKTEDIAKFGQLYLQRGNWEGKSILPSEWIEEASTAHIMQPGEEKDRPNSDWLQGYGYQFWRCRHNGYRGDGAYGQYCVVMPEQQMVIAITSETNDMQGILNLAWKHLLATGGSNTASSPLKSKLWSLSLPLPKGNADSPIARRVNKKSYTVNDNSLGITKIDFDLKAGNGHLYVTDTTGRHNIPFGMNKWEKGETQLHIEWAKLVPTAIPGNPSLPTRASASWRDDNTLDITCRFIDTAHYFRLACGFAADKITVDIYRSISIISKDEKPFLVLQGSTVS